MDQQRLQLTLDRLQGCMDQDANVRSAAEAQLDQDAQAAGFGVVLCHIATSQQEGLHFGVRQLAAVVLKKYIKEHWMEDTRSFRPPVVNESDKQSIRQLLPAGLADPNSKIRTAVGMAIASIAKWDYPQQWPGLLEWLVASVKERSNDHLGRYTHSMHCLERLRSFATGNV